ncbi:MAG: acyltransferase [Candidatus Bathyarchaeota archaeon]|nr:acyltransferase [Candidatus Bathyarchaeota archaeon]
MQENLKFTYLKAVGILLVVLNHAHGGGILFVFFTYWFPPASFYMPLFVFAAGYFYSETLSAFSYIRKRFFRLVVPYYVWNLFYGLLVTVLVYAGFSSVGNPITPYNYFIAPWITSNSGYAFNDVTWFALWLFVVQATYSVVRNAVRLRNEYALLGLCFALGLVGTYLSTVDILPEPLSTQLVKLLFGLPFVQLGFLYRIKLEARDKPSIKSLVLVFLIQGALIGIFNSEFPFKFYVVKGGFDNVFLPFLTSLTGIWFWVQICGILSSKIGSIRVLRFLGNHTWDIMVHHMLGFWLLNTVFFLINAPDFDITQYTTKIMYVYEIGGDNHSLILYAIAGITVSLSMFKIVALLRERLSKLLITKNISPKFFRKTEKLNVT